MGVKHEVPQGFILGHLFFLLHINDLLNIISDMSKPILFADDTSILLKISILMNLKKNILTMSLLK
jgi:hypothetical protein